jgi:hypothetical protein
MPVIGTIPGDFEFLEEIEDRLKDASIPFDRAFSKLTVQCLIAMVRRLLDEKVAFLDGQHRKCRSKSS